MPGDEGTDPAPSVDSLRKKEDALLERAAAVKEQWKLLITGYKFPPPEPERATTHWDYLLREAKWLAEDVMQERLWKQAAAVQVAAAAVAYPRSALRHVDTVVKTGDRLGTVRAGPSSAAQGCSEVAAGGVSAPADVEDSLAPSTPRRDWEDSCLFYVSEAYDLSDALARQLDEADVLRLAQQATVLSTYQELYEISRASRGRTPLAHLESGAPGRDDDPLTARKANAPRRKQPKASPLLGDDEFSDPGMGGGRNSMILRRAPTGGYRTSVVLDDDGGLGDGGREKRKRKTRDFGDEDYIPASKRPGDQPRRTQNGALPGRDGFDRQNRRNVNGRPGPSTRGGLPPGPSLNSSMGLRQSLDLMPRLPAGVGRGGNMTRSNSAERAMGAWSHADEQMLAAVVTEFGINWLLVSDVMRSSSAMQGIFRRPDSCKQRYQHLQKAMAEQGEDGADAVPSHQPLMTKIMAKELLAASLPVSDSVLKRHQDAVALLAQRLKSKHMADRQTARDGQRLRADMHGSHVKIQQNVLATQGGRLLNPLEFSTSSGSGDAPLPLLGGAAGNVAGNGAQPSRAPAAAAALDATAAAAAATVLAGAPAEANPASAINSGPAAALMAGGTAQANGHLGHDTTSASTPPNLNLPATTSAQQMGMPTPPPPLASTTGVLPQPGQPHDPNALKPPSFPSSGMPAAATASTQQQLLLPGGPALSMQQMGQPMGQQQQQQSTLQAMQQQLHNMQFAAGQTPNANGNMLQQQQLQQQQQLMQGALNGPAQLLPGQPGTTQQQQQQQQQQAAGQMVTQQFMAQLGALNRAGAGGGMLPGMSLGAAGTPSRDQLAVLTAQHQKIQMAQRQQQQQQQLQQLQQQQRGAGPGQAGQPQAGQFATAAGGAGPNMWGSTPPLGQQGTAAQVGPSSTLPAGAMALQPGGTPNFMQQQLQPPQGGMPTNAAMQTAVAAVLQQQQQQQAQMQQLSQQRVSPSLTAPQQATMNARFPGLANAAGGAASGTGSPGPMAQNNQGLISTQLAAAQMRAQLNNPASLATMQQALGRMNQLRPAANFPAGLQGMGNGMPGQMANNMQHLMAGGMLGPQAAGAAAAAAGLRTEAFTNAMWSGLATAGNAGQQHALLPQSAGGTGGTAGASALPALAGTPTPQQVGSPGMGQALQQQQQQPLQLAKPPG